MANKFPVFILSCGRSGSLSIAKSLAQHPEIGAFHEPFPYLLRENILHYLDRLLGKEYHLKDPEQKISNKRSKIIEETLSKNKYYVESSHFLSTFAKELVSLFPNALVIHLIRDGRDVVRSGMDFGWYDEKPRREKIECTTQSNPYGVIAWPAPFEYKTRFSKCCYYWYLQNKIIEDDLKYIPEKNKLVVRMEDLKEQGLGPILEKLGIEGDYGLLHEHKGKREYPHWKNWKKKEIEEAEEIMGELLNKHGYETSQF